MIWRKAALLALALSMPVLFAACPKNDPPSRPRATISTSSRPVPTTPIVAAFNGEKAMDHVRKQIEFGPRPPDTPQLAKTRAYIANELRSYGLTVSFDEFTAKTPQGEKKMANIVADWDGYRRASAEMRESMRRRIADEQAILYPLLQTRGG